MKKLIILMLLLTLPSYAEFIYIKGGISIDTKDIKYVRYRDLDIFEKTGNILIHLKDGKVLETARLGKQEGFAEVERVSKILNRK